MRTQIWDSRVKRTNTRNLTLWALQGLAGAVFLLAGSSKLFGAVEMVRMFDAVGIGQWFRILTGAIEVVGAILLVTPSLAAVGALALVATMVGAVFAHLFVIGGNPALPIVLLVVTATIAWARGAR